MEIISLSLCGQPMLMGNWVVAHLMDRKLQNEVFLIKGQTLAPLKQFALATLSPSVSSVQLLVTTLQAKETLLDAVAAFTPEAFDPDGFWQGPVVCKENLAEGKR